MKNKNILLFYHFKEVATGLNSNFLWNPRDFNQFNQSVDFNLSHFQIDLNLLE